jgi:hypothetical protein
MKGEGGGGENWEGNDGNVQWQIDLEERGEAPIGTIEEKSRILINVIQYRGHCGHLARIVRQRPEAKRGKKKGKRKGRMKERKGENEAGKRKESRGVSSQVTRR